MPAVPAHLWLPKAHVEAPTAGSVLLAGILLKLGSYGFIRFLLFLFPAASFYFLPLILAIVIISIILPSFTVLRQTDLKRIIAYSSVAHMNFLVGAIFVQNLIALTGSLLLQIAHGLSSSALFLTIGMLYDRYKSRNIFYYAGLVTLMPLFSFFFFVFSLANLGFPSTINFVSEMLIFIGMFQMSPSVTILTLTGIFLSAAYSFVLLTRLLFGPASRQIHKFYDLTRREFYILLPLAFLIFFLGLFPNYLISFWSFNITTWFSEPTFILAVLIIVPFSSSRLKSFSSLLVRKRMGIHSVYFLSKAYYSALLIRLQYAPSSVSNHSFPIPLKINITMVKIVPTYTLCKRYMMLNYCTSAARASYHLLKILASHSALDNPKQNDHMTNAIVEYALDNNQGIMPHKSVLLKHILSGKQLFPAQDVYGQFKVQTDITNVTCANQSTDTRVMAELGTVKEYMNSFGHDIINLHANIDSHHIPLRTVPGQQQSNHDFAVTLKTAWNNLNFSGYKKVLHDQKSGKGALDHSTSGSLGIVYYDQNNAPIQYMTEPYSLDMLLHNDLHRLDSIFNAMINDKIENDFLFLKKQAKNLLLNDKHTVEWRHNAYQNLLWLHVQTNPKYTRSLSFIFINNMQSSTLLTDFEAFEKEFKNALPNKLYNLDKRGDCREITIAMLKAYQKTVDPKIFDKIKYLEAQGNIKFNKKFLEDLAIVIKKYAFFT